MKKTFYIIIFWSVLFYTACFDDKSSVAEDFIPEVEIDTTGIPAQLSVIQYGRLKISPKVSQNGVNDPSHFSYKWMLNTIATTTQSTGGSYANYICIGEQEALDTVIVLDPNATTYFLWYQVTDNQTGLRKDILWKVLVQAAYNEGILIAESFDGKTTDLSLIEGKQFTEGWTEDTRISRNLYSERNGGTYNGLIRQICHSYNSTLKSKRFYCIGDNFYALIDGLDYELVGSNFDVIYDNTIHISPSQMFYFRSYPTLVNEGSIYPFSASLRRDYPNISIPMGISLQVGEGTVLKTSKVDKYIAYSHESSNSSRPWGCWYDKELGMFLHQKRYPYVKNNIASFSYDPATHPFDPNNVSNLETQYAAVGVNDDFYMIMKNTITSSYQIYVLSRTNCCAKALYHISGNEMDDAIDYVVSEDANVIYFATKKEVYAIVLGGASPQVNKIYTLTSGEITHFSMFRQAWYLLNTQTYVSGVGYKVPIDEHEHLLMAGVWDGSSGSLLAIPIVSPSGGTIDNNNITTYSGFGKILTVVSQQ